MKDKQKILSLDLKLSDETLITITANSVTFSPAITMLSEELIMIINLNRSLTEKLWHREGALPTEK